VQLLWRFVCAHSAHHIHCDLLLLQVGILQKMQHCRNTVRLLGCYETNDEVMVVTGLCSGGDLQKLSDVSPSVSSNRSSSSGGSSRAAAAAAV
jgi:serine/threonine protein kinase